MTIHNESWDDLTAKIENAKLQLIVSRRKIRSENATINFKNFVRGFVEDTNSIAFIYAQFYAKVKNPTADYDIVKLIAKGAMAVYGGWNPTDPVTITPFWEVPVRPWDERR